MRRLLPLLLAGLLALAAQPAMANQMVVRGSVSHHHHFFFHHNNRGIDAASFFSPAVNPFFFPTFTLASPFIAQSLPFIAQPLPFSSGLGSSGFGAFGGGFGAPVAFGGAGFPEGGTFAEPRVIVVAAPFAGPPPRRPEEERASVEQTPSGVTIIRGPGLHH